MHFSKRPHKPISTHPIKIMIHLCPNPPSQPHALRSQSLFRSLTRANAPNAASANRSPTDDNALQKPQRPVTQGHQRWLCDQDRTSLTLPALHRIGPTRANCTWGRPSPKKSLPESTCQGLFCALAALFVTVLKLTCK